MARPRNPRHRTPSRRPDQPAAAPTPSTPPNADDDTVESPVSPDPAAEPPTADAAATNGDTAESPGPVEPTDDPAAESPSADAAATNGDGAESPGPGGPAVRRGRGRRARPKLSSPPKLPVDANGSADTKPVEPALVEPVEPAPVEPEPEPEPVEPAASGDDAGERPKKGQSRQRGVRAALATLPVPEPGPSFWADIDRSMAEQPPLSITARPAIRPITEPPPLSQPSLADHLGSSAVLITGDEPAGFDDVDPPDGPTAPAGAPPSTPGAPQRSRFGDPNGSNTRTAVILVVVAVVAVLAAGNFLGSRSDDPSGADTTVTTAASTTTTAARATTTVPSVPGLTADARLTPTGLGPLAIGTSLRDLAGAGIKIDYDRATFATSSGACYDAKLPGATDLTLRFRSPDEDAGVTDPLDGRLASIGITVAPGSPRLSETGVRLGASEDEVRNAHGGNVEVTGHPTNPGGHLMISYAPGGKGVAYGTDGQTVKEIAVGYADTISQRQGCR